MKSADGDEQMPATKPLVPYRMTICGLNELHLHRDGDVTHVLSILDPEWPDPIVFDSYHPHRRLVRRFDDVLTEYPGAVVPDEAHVTDILAWSHKLADEAAQHVLIHCHAGVSRSTAAAAMLLAKDNPGSEAEAFAVLRRVRPRSWPNSRMVQIADDMLARKGALLTALRKHQRWVATTHPDLAELLRGGDRAHEVLGL